MPLFNGTIKKTSNWPDLNTLNLSGGGGGFLSMHLHIEQRIKCFAVIAHKSELAAYLSIMVALTALTVATADDYS